MSSHQALSVAMSTRARKLVLGHIVAQHGVIIGQLVLRDFTMIKIMLTAIAVGGLASGRSSRSA